MCPIQCWGLGDVLFIMPICYYWIKQGYKVLYPIHYVYLSISKHFPEITFIDSRILSVDYNIAIPQRIGNLYTIPLRFSDSIMKVQYKYVMKSKYDMVGLDWTKWKDDYIVERDYENENKLYREVLGLKEGEKYNLISEQFTTGGARRGEIPTPNNGLRNVYMSIIDGFTAIDWLKTLQNATEIFAVSSSNIYLFELFEMKAEKINLYIRRPNEQNHDNYSYLLTKDNYILHP